MEQFTDEDRKKLYGLLRVLWQLSSKEIAKELHLSKSVVSRHMTCEILNDEICVYLIEKIFAVKVKVINFKEL